MLVAAAVKLFERGKISAGKAAELAGIPQAPVSRQAGRVGRVGQHAQCGGYCSGHCQCLRPSSVIPPLQYLYELGQFALLPRFYQQVTIPPAVVQELADGHALGVALPVGAGAVGAVQAPVAAPVWPGAGMEALPGLRTGRGRTAPEHAQADRSLEETRKGQTGMMTQTELEARLLAVEAALQRSTPSRHPGSEPELARRDYRVVQR